jgi:hypothetical protein
MTKQLYWIRKLVLLAALCTALSANAQNLVADGGFENTPPGSSDFSAAWTLNPPRGSGPGQQFSNVGTSQTFARSGENYANLAPAVGQTGSLSQVLTTTPGQLYALSFFLANDSALPTNFFRVIVNGSVIFSATSPPFPANGVYQPAAASFTATGTSTTLQFEYRHDDDFWRLDDVSVTADGPPPSPTPSPTATPSPTPPSRLANISTRLRVQTGDNALIGGFILTGSQPKKVILRAIGPSLAEQGVQGALADPTLELHGPDGLLGANNDWKDTQRTEIEASTIPPKNDLESAIVATLPADGSAYTAVMRGRSETTGVGLVEVYDLSESSNSRLANISSRGFVQTGENVMIGGLIVRGTAPQRVLIRAIGPSLPVAGKLADPHLELFDGNGTLLQANDNWRSDQEAEINATTIPPSHDAESAIVRNLVPAGYTAIVRGVNQATGVALVEVYAIN